MKDTYLGVTDLPRIPERNNDLIGTDPYAEGLVSFITQCPTPMSIAIQGDWGSGKTSIINFLKRSVDDKNNDSQKGEGYQTIIINTWQFSKLDSARLFESVIYTILDDLSSKSQNRDKLMKFGKSLLKVAASAATNFTGLSADVLAEEVLSYETNICEVKKLHDNFSAAIKSVLKERGLHRLVLFVDDLDRLNPGVAVELLEAFKLFMDVEGCVFVLAVDYDVIVQGVRDKYGKDMPLKKCRSFFDKIIQVPFHMPVERYNLMKMAEEYLGNRLKNKEYLKIVGEYATMILGKNPRSMKRMVNAFNLIDLIHNQINKEKKTEQDYDAILFCVLCIQIQLPELYDYISETNSILWSDIGTDGIMREEVKESLVSRLDVLAEESERKKEAELFIAVLDGLINVLSKLYDSDKSKYDNRFDTLAKVLELSSVTGRDENSGKRRVGGISSTIDHILRVIKYMAEAGTFDNPTYNKATKAVAEEDKIGASTVQSQCTRSLGLSGVGDFVSLCNDYYLSRNDKLLSVLNKKVSPDKEVKIKMDLESMRKQSVY